MMSGCGSGSGQVSVPPGFRFHPTEEELLYYYLKKKVSYEAIDLDVIREVDLNKLEPWDLKDRCRIGSGPQNEWYFFSHKDKKYPTGTRTNRATIAGFWKATGRDKAIYHGNAKRIGMRKTLVFYTGRAPHGHKTDWIMHEYRLNDDHLQLQQEDGWVICRVFKKKNHGRGLQPELLEEDCENYSVNHPSSSHLMKPSSNMTTSSTTLLPPRQNGYSTQPSMFPNNYTNYTLDGTMHLPQLSSLDSVSPNGSTLFTTMDNVLKLSTSLAGGILNPQQLLAAGVTERLANGGEWGFLDELLANYQSLEQQQQQQQQQQEASLNKIATGNHDIIGMSSTSGLQHQHKFPFQYLGSELDLLRFSK
ncbi:hypothetical protein BVRB_1g011220 [Beta vulgaris subsp. vulgaris]|nr:hypothetical protein BVRB_1g011220 [Beta vulgaris subsp. vulgaris]